MEDSGKKKFWLQDFDLDKFKEDRVMLGRFFDETEANKIFSGEWSELIEVSDPSTNEKETGKIKMVKDSNNNTKVFFVPVKEEFPHNPDMFNTENMRLFDDGKYILISPEKNPELDLLGKYYPELRDFQFYSFEDKNIPHKIGERTLTKEQRRDLMQKELNKNGFVICTRSN